MIYMYYALYMHAIINIDNLEINSYLTTLNNLVAV